MMKVEINELMDEFRDNLKLDYDLKKKIGLTSEAKLKLSLRQII
tara:strand:+ start:534 stop:665 length:132 start_codon:yes stop_codon:yes gene_type:complete